ncbi:MAG: cdc20 [Chlamydiia bacterium]|nr:cdc20 [Chlamydiia bacterium]
MSLLSSQTLHYSGTSDQQNYEPPKAYVGDRLIALRNVPFEDLRQDKLQFGSTSLFTEASLPLPSNLMEDRYIEKQVNQIYKDALSVSFYGDMYQKIVKQPILSFGTPHTTSLSTALSGIDRKMGGKITLSMEGRRQISSTPFKILDAPLLTDNFYSQPISWSSSNQLGIALDNTIYVYDVLTQGIDSVYQADHATKFPQTITWLPGGNTFGFGSNRGDINFFDIAKKAIVNTCNRGVRSRLFSIQALSDKIVVGGARSGELSIFDQRTQSIKVKSYQAMGSSVCSLGVSPVSSLMLAAGYSNGKVRIWDLRLTERPVVTFSEFTDAVKALSWTPWDPERLLAGGSSKDRHIRLLNTHTETVEDSVDTGSQVCTIQVSEYYREFISTHGSPHNTVHIWKNLKKATARPSLLIPCETLCKAETRVLHSAMSPDGIALVAGSSEKGKKHGDIKFWKVFEHAKEKKTRDSLFDRYTIR